MCVCMCSMPFYCTVSSTRHQLDYSTGHSLLVCSSFRSYLLSPCQLWVDPSVFAIPGHPSVALHFAAAAASPRTPPTVVPFSLYSVLLPQYPHCLFLLFLLLLPTTTLLDAYVPSRILVLMPVYSAWPPSPRGLHRTDSLWSWSHRVSIVPIETCVQRQSPVVPPHHGVVPILSAHLDPIPP